MSTLRNALHRRDHKERAQPLAREKRGLLEKHKDYVLRAKDYNFKQKRLKSLKEKAFFRNPDEFYFKMINTKTKGGVHIAQRNDAYAGEDIKLLKSQDLNYIKTQRDIGNKKVDRLLNDMILLDNGDEMITADSEDAETSVKPKHIIFVDSKEEAANFDPVKHFGTLPELINQKFNRPRVETLEQERAIAPGDDMIIKELRKERLERYKELLSRIERDKKMSKLERELVIQKALMGKGRRVKIGEDANGLPIYKWKYDRKK
ncbi:2356_t:CDS:2 [Paraglomus occultum]|uniref:U3 small nucleolar RNA-associated protein 11 n=1 Tax=Paraglomus occultum TaxID=144539 RepID=A0A9N8ZB18_9GLOM|nr:2356_t:CDS:2 [Paraglomus occultum]